MRCLLLATAAIVLLSHPSFATFLSYVHTTAGSDTPYTDAFTLPAFDPSLGTLTAVEIIQTADATASVTVVNPTAVPQAFSDLTASMNVTVDGPNNMIFGFPVSSGSIAGVAAPGANLFTAATVATATDDSFVPSADFNDYIAPPAAPTFTFSAIVGAGGYTVSAALASAGLDFGSSASVGGTTEIIYTYDAADQSGTGAVVNAALVPEPASLAVLAFGCTGLLRLRRKH